MIYILQEYILLTNTKWNNLISNFHKIKVGGNMLKKFQCCNFQEMLSKTLLIIDLQAYYNLRNFKMFLCMSTLFVLNDPICVNIFFAKSD